VHLEHVLSMRPPEQVSIKFLFHVLLCVGKPLSAKQIWLQAGETIAAPQQVLERAEAVLNDTFCDH